MGSSPVCDYCNITFVAVTNTTYATRQYTDIPNPGVLDKDYLLLTYLWARNATGIGDPMTVPSGFTPLIDTLTAVAGGFTVNMRVYGKFAGTSEPSNYEFAQSDNLFNTQGILHVYRGVNLTNPLDTTPSVNGYTSNNGTTYTFSGITTATNHAMIVAIGHDWGDFANNLTPPAGMTERLDTSIVYTADAYQDTAGPTGDKTMGSNSSLSDPWSTVLLALRSS